MTSELRGGSESGLFARPIGILVVDADADAGAAFAKIVDAEGGFWCAEAIGRETALSKLREQHIEMVVSSSPQLLAELRVVHPNVVRVLMTDDAYGDACTAALHDSTAWAAIEKPWRSRTLVTTLRAASTQVRAARVAARRAAPAASSG